MTMNRRRFIESTIGAGILLPQASALASIFENQVAPCPSGDNFANSFCTYGNIKARVISTKNDLMSDSFRVPPLHDGMGIVSQSETQMTLIRNHEIKEDEYIVPAALKQYAYDPACPGGTTTLVIDSDLNIIEQKYSLLGTLDNCSGGITPWGTWLSCEEEFLTPNSNEVARKRHGYVFEVDPRKSLAENSVPLKGLGRFNHEAAVVDPDTSIVYLTEDRWDSSFYRFIPNQRGQLQKGGKLQALKLDKQYKSYEFEKGVKYPCQWVNVPEVDPNKDNVRHQVQNKGAQSFIRGEGASYHLGKIYFTCTQGGGAKKGQIFSYDPMTSMLELFYEAKRNSIIRMPDNISSTPWGDLLVCEDDGKVNLLTKITMDGKVSRIAKSNDGEWAGVCADQTGKYIFANVQGPGLTVAFTGFQK